MYHPRWRLLISDEFIGAILQRNDVSIIAKSLRPVSRTCSARYLTMGSATHSTSADPPQESLQARSEVKYNGKTYSITREGTAEILELKREADPKSTKNQSQSVFYNPIQQYNRDLSVLAIRAFIDDKAVIRKAQVEKSVEKRRQKRKRPKAESKKDAEEPVTTKSKSDGDNFAANGIGNVPITSADGGGAQHESPLPEAGVDAQANEQRHLDVHDDARAADETTQSYAEGGVPSTSKVDRLPFADGPFRILDALSATGLRALRYAREIPMATAITANDLSSSATAQIKVNVNHNKLSDKIQPITSNAIAYMHRVGASEAGVPNSYHVIDLDPYGTAAPFLDAAVRAVCDGGLLCVTCTDSGVFASIGYHEKTYSQYGGLPLKGPHAHEGGLRLILHSIATSAARYGLAIEPLLSLSIDYYTRVFVRIHHSHTEVKCLASKTMIVYSCHGGCGAWSTQHLTRIREMGAKNGQTFYNFKLAQAPSANTHCEHCGSRTHMAGPMWGGPLHNPHFIQRILDMLPTLDPSIYGTIPRIQGMLSVALNESLEDPLSSSHAEPGTSSEAPSRPVPPMNPAARAQHPFFFLPSALSRVLHCVSPSDAAVRGALMGLGYRTTRSHTKAGSICTDAPWSVIWEVMREWVRQKSPIKERALKEGTAGWAIMRKGRKFTKVMDAKDQLRQALEDKDIRDVASLTEKVRAALDSLSKLKEPSEERDEGLGSQSHNASGAEGAKPLPTGEAEGSEARVSGARPSKLNIVFDEKLGREPQRNGMVRYQPNPTPNWGPMSKARGDG